MQNEVAAQQAVEDGIWALSFLEKLSVPLQEVAAEVQQVWFLRQRTADHVS